MSAFSRNLSVLAGVVILAVGSLYALGYFSPHSAAIKYGISPYQDTAMPVIADTTGIFKRHGLDVELVTVPWENVVPSLASRGKTVDVAIGSINTFLPRAFSVNNQSDDPVVFFTPFYIFNGASFIADKNSGLKPYKTLLSEHNNDTKAALIDLMAQLRGKHIGYPSGTPYEQMFLQAQRSGDALSQKYDTRDVQLADGLPALLTGTLDVAAAGVTQRTEALRHGDFVLIESEDLGLSEVIGLMTTQKFLAAHPAELAKLRDSWFESIQGLKSDPELYAAGVIDYLAKNASTKYTYSEYMASLSAQVFPETQQKANDLFYNPASHFFWKRIWDNVDAYLAATNKVTAPVPYNYFINQKAVAQ